MELNYRSCADTIRSSKTLKKEWKIHYMENITSKNYIMIYYIVARLRWGVNAKTVTKKIPALSV